MKIDEMADFGQLECDFLGGVLTHVICYRAKISIAVAFHSLDLFTCLIALYKEWWAVPTLRFPNAEWLSTA